MGSALQSSYKVYRTRSAAESVLAAVGDVQEAILVLVIFVDIGHEGRCITGSMPTVFSKTPAAVYLNIASHSVLLPGNLAQGEQLPTCGRQHILDEHEDSLLWADLDPLANDVHELTHSEISRYKVPTAKRKIVS